MMTKEEKFRDAIFVIVDEESCPFYSVGEEIKVESYGLSMASFKAARWASSSPRRSWILVRTWPTWCALLGEASSSRALAQVASAASRRPS